MRYRLFAIFALCLALDLNGCEERAKPAPPIKQEKLYVICTVYPLASVARQIGGDHVIVEWVAESGQPMPGKDLPNDEVAGRIRRADLVLSSGEPWATEGYDDPIRGVRIIRLDLLPSAAASPGPQGLRWLDPAVARELAIELYNRLTTQRPRFEPEFRARRDKFLQELDDLVRHYRAVLTARPPRQALVLSSDWIRLLSRFEMAALIPVEANPSALSAAQVRQIVEAARQARLTVLFVHADTPPAVVRDLQDRTDLTVMKLEALGTSASGGRTTLLEILQFNLDQLNQGASRLGR